MIEKEFTSRDCSDPQSPIINIFDGIPGDLAEERFDTLLHLGAVRIERIVSAGQVTPEGEWYDQGWDEWILLLAGRATLALEGDHEPRLLTVGDCTLIPAHQRHRVEWTSPDEKTVWLAVHIGESRQ